MPSTAIFSDVTTLPATLRADGARLDVWRLDLAVDDATAARLAARLDAEERARAARLRVPARRRRFEVARGALRGLLARYTDRRPDEVRFAYGEQGKPALVGPAAPRIGVAHSEDVALVAVHPRVDVGIDVEVLREVRELDAVARRFLRPAERDALAALPAYDRSAAFLAGWTRTEACIKLVGGALFAELPRIEVREDGVGGVTAVRRGDDGERRFAVIDLRPGDDAVAAVAVEGPAPAVAAYRLRGPLP